jgi:hypothetical protein
MEVHAHSHTARKKWTHYFWEFLILNDCRGVASILFCNKGFQPFEKGGKRKGEP